MVQPVVAGKVLSDTLMQVLNPLCKVCDLKGFNIIASGGTILAYVIYPNGFAVYPCSEKPLSELISTRADVWSALDVFLSTGSFANAANSRIKRSLSLNESLGHFPLPIL